MNTCEFCNKEFANLYILKNHIKTSKKCILLRDKNDIEIIEYVCDWCKKTCSTVANLNSHKNNCKLNPERTKEYLIKQLNEEISSIKQKEENYKNELQNMKNLIKEKEENYKNELQNMKNLIKEKEDNYKEELHQKDIEIERLKTEIRVKNEIKEDIDKKDDKYLNTIKEVVNKSTKTINNTKNTVNNIYVQQQLDKLIPINELPNLIASSPHLSNTLKSLDSLEKFYYLCANESKKCFLVKDSSREIVSGRKVDENNNVEYITGKIQSLLGDYIVNEDLCKKVKEEYSVMLDNINSTEELTSEEGDSGENLQQLCYKLYKSKKEKVVDEDLVNNISKKAMTVLFKIKKEDYP